jgi:hypothetical protein
MLRIGTTPVLMGLSVLALPVLAGAGTDVIVPLATSSEESCVRVWVHNPSATPARVEVQLLQDSWSNGRSFVFRQVVEADQSVSFHDPAWQLFRSESSGALRVASDHSRLVVGSGESIGCQSHEAIRPGHAPVPASFAVGHGETLLLVGETGSVTLAEVNGAPATVSLVRVDENGDRQVSQSVELGPNGVTTQQLEPRSLGALHIRGAAGNGRVVATAAGARLVPHHTEHHSMIPPAAAEAPTEAETPQPRSNLSSGSETVVADIVSESVAASFASGDRGPGDVDGDDDTDAADLACVAVTVFDPDFGCAVASADHDHLGQTWTGWNNPLVINGSYGIGSAPLELSNDSGAGLWVDYASNAGVLVSRAGNMGVFVGSVTGSGVEVGSAGTAGVFVNSSQLAGFRAKTVGNPTDSVSSSHDNGLEVDGAEGHGVFVGHADLDGMHIIHAADDGIDIASAGDDGVYVASAADKGVVAAGDTTGVWANTTQTNHEWGVYTNDKIYAGTARATSGPDLVVAQNGGTDGLSAGDIVAVSGLGAPFGESSTPVPGVRHARAGDEATVLGVVSSRFVLEEASETVEIDGSVEEHTFAHATSAAGAAAPGEHVLVAVTGVARVKLGARSDTVRPGRPLTVDPAGRATTAETDASSGAFATALEGAQAARDGMIWALVNPR